MCVLRNGTIDRRISIGQRTIERPNRRTRRQTLTASLSLSSANALSLVSSYAPCCRLLEGMGKTRTNRDLALAKRGIVAAGAGGTGGSAEPIDKRGKTEYLCSFWCARGSGEPALARPARVDTQPVVAASLRACSSRKTGTRSTLQSSTRRRPRLLPTPRPQPRPQQSPLLRQRL